MNPRCHRPQAAQPPRGKGPRRAGPRHDATKKPLECMNEAQRDSALARLAISLSGEVGAIGGGYAGVRVRAQD